MKELGTSSNPSANLCLVYNCYGSVQNPSSCAMPSPGSGNNGNVMGYYDVDNYSTAYTHTEAYTYDSVGTG